MNKKNSVPKIRFKDFEDNWKSRKLSEISDKVTEKNKDNMYIETLTNSAALGIISQRDYFDKDISNAKNLNGYYVVKPNDFVYNPRISKFAPVGPIKRNNLERTGVMSPLYYVFRTNNINGAFLERYFSSNWWHRFMKINGDSGARSDRFAIKDSVFCEMSIPYPSINEQNKISVLFEKLDKTVMHHQELLNDHKKLKKAMLQKMFPQKGETVPRVRFAEFNDSWIEKRLVDIVKIRRGLTYKPNDVSSNGVRVLRSSNIKEDIFKLRKDDVFVQEKAINIPEVENGDILITAANGSIRLVGKHAIINNLPSNTVHGGFMLVIHSDHNPFINTWMSSSEYKRTLEFVQGGNGSIGNLSIKTLESAKISIPSKEERILIGQYFTKIESIITFHQNKLETYQELKKAMLQKMFV
ncbi:restriction endonuclease subunit S [Carnobacterium sp. TMP28]|uniref:restriction endonuclease subunit S n=1 Tax=Carnobacterium sp. TMP28 TaxID=3397060 RepID=UPI0039E1AC2F